MVKQFKQFVKSPIALLLMSLFVCVGLASCQADGDSELANTSNDKVEINFTLSLSAPGTRAESHTTTQEVTDKEKAVNNLQVLLCDKDGNYVDKFLLYSFDGEKYRGGIAKVTISGDNCVDASGTFIGRIMVLANCPTYRENVDGELGNFAYTYASHNPADEDGYIPMWGVISGKDIHFSNGEESDLGTVDLLRAMAKIELIPNNGFGEGLSALQSATLNRYNATGTCVPADHKNYTKTADAEQDKTNIPSSVQASSTSLAFTKNTSDGHYIVYIPEMAKSEDNTITVSVKDASNAVQDYTFHLGDYTEEGGFNNEYYDIVRNHIYQYYLNVSNDKLLINEEVLPWGNVESEVSWDGSNGVLLAWNGKSTDAKKGNAEALFCLVNYPRYTDNNHSTTEDKTSGASFSFQLSEPAGVVWQAYLTNSSDFRFSTAKRDGSKDNNVTCASIGIARSEAYNIKVEAIHSWNDTGWKGSRGDYGIYTDFFIVTKNESGEPTPVTINPCVDGLTSTYWKNNRCFAGGGYEQTVTVDGKSVTLGEGQWVRIWQCEAKAKCSYDDLAKAISQNQESKDQYWKGSK